MSGNGDYTYKVLRADTEIEEMIDRAGGTFSTESEEAYAEGVLATLEWLFDDISLEPIAHRALPLYKGN